MASFGIRHSACWATGTLDAVQASLEHRRPSMRFAGAGSGFKIGSVCLGAALGLLTGCGPKAQTQAPPARTGAEIYQACLICHSTREMQRGPVIDGLPAWYAKDQLFKFHRGVRGKNPENKSEALMASGMSTLRHEGEIGVVAEYLSGLPPQSYRRTVRGDAQRGRGLYQSCVPCHGPRGEGNELVKGPPLRLLEDWYLLEQLRKIQAGQRSTGPNDVQMTAMRAAIGAFKGEDLRDVVAHIAADLAGPPAP